ncbi:ABC transporter permease [Bacteroidota bacterium]
MKRFLAFVKKEFYHIFRDYRTVLILFGMPVMQILLFGFAITNEIKDARIAILDNSKDHVSQKIISKILSSGYFILDTYLNSYHEIDPEFRKGKIKEVIIFEPDFAKNLDHYGKASMEIITDATDPNTATTLANYTRAILADYQMDVNKTSMKPIMITPEFRMEYNPNMKGVFMFVPGLITIILMLVSAMMTSISLTREKELGTMEVILASPMKPVQVIVAKVIPYILLSFCIALIILTLGYFVFGVPVKGSLILLLLETILFIITVLSLGILISSITSSQQVALMISLMALILPTILLSGFIFPIENMPVLLQWISNIIPAKWYIIIIKSIMLKGTGFGLIWKETLIIVLFALFFIGVSVKKYKIRLE